VLAVYVEANSDGTTYDIKVSAVSASPVEDGVGDSTNVPVTNVTVTPETLSLEVGETGKLTATVIPENATNKTVTWEGSGRKKKKKGWKEIWERGWQILNGESMSIAEIR